MKINKIRPLDNGYAKLLVNISNPPKILYYKGILPTSRQKTVAIVGARKPTAYGKEVASKLAYELAQNGIIVVSGLALGIDGIAHQGALDGGGITIAVLANGLDKFYPRSNSKLGESIIASGGAIISEYSEGSPALPHQFLNRNRIVSGLADIVVVVEAASRSGTLSTANHALNQGKDVFAVPGNITSPLSAGCNNLIKSGAQPLTSTNDIIDILLPNKMNETHQQATLFANTGPNESIILKLLLKGEREGATLLRLSGLSVSNFNQALTILEINGQIKALGASQWTIR